MKGKRIAIVGGGPAGITAAVQLKRYYYNPVIFEPNRIGGLLHNAWKIENYPGFPGGVSGMKLAELFQEQLAYFAVEVRQEKVDRLDFDDDRFSLRTQIGYETYDLVVVASGTSPKTLAQLKPLPAELKRYVFFEVRPLLEHQNKNITIIGAGDAAFDYALSLADKNAVTILNHSDIIAAMPRLQQSVREHPNIEYRQNTKLIGTTAAENNQLALHIDNGYGIITIISNALLVAIGRIPCRDFYTENLLRLEERLLLEGRLYLAGDTKNAQFRQTAIAVSDGLRCAMEIYNKLKEY